MKAMKVRVRNGRIEGEAPRGLADGDLMVCLADQEDDLTDEELSKLNEALEAGWRSMQAGRARPASELLAELASKR